MIAICWFNTKGQLGGVLEEVTGGKTLTQNKSIATQKLREYTGWYPDPVVPNVRHSEGRTLRICNLQAQEVTPERS